MKQKPKAITLRNLPPELERLVRQKAKANGTSINKAVIQVLKDSCLSSPQKRGRVSHDDLDFLSGSWTRKETDQFDEYLTRQRRIDPELWK